MKVRDRVCDICGESVYKHARHQYKLSKRLWEVNSLWTKVDLCEECWNYMERLILNTKMERANENSN